MKIIVQNSYAENYASLGNLTWHKNKVDYAARHEYETRLEVYPNNSHLPSYHGFKKIYHVQRIFKEDNPDWVWVTGCDSMITNFNIKLESIIDNAFHFIIAKDQNGINMDSFLIRNSPEGIDFLKFIASNYDAYKDHTWAEQQCVIDNEEKFSSITKIVPQRTFNSYNYDFLPNEKPNLDGLGFDGNWQAGDFLIHWPATPLNRRIHFFERYSQHIIL